MADWAADIPVDLRLTFDRTPSIETLRTLGNAIDAFNARMAPLETQRFALLLHAQDGSLTGGLFGVLAWQWLFVQALWVDDVWRRRGIGRALLARAEAHAETQGCHSVWLDTFQARGFYLKLGYQEFGALEDYPAGQTRSFLRKQLRGDAP